MCSSLQQSGVRHGSSRGSESHMKEHPSHSTTPHCSWEVFSPRVRTNVRGSPMRQLTTIWSRGESRKIARTSASLHASECSLRRPYVCRLLHLSDPRLSRGSVRAPAEDRLSGARLRGGSLDLSLLPRPRGKQGPDDGVRLLSRLG